MVAVTNTSNLSEDDLLIAQLHLQDAEEYSSNRRRKGKGREGAPPTDSIYAIELQADMMKEYIAEMSSLRAAAGAFDGRHEGRGPARSVSPGTTARPGSSKEVSPQNGGVHEGTSSSLPPAQRSSYSNRYSHEHRF